MGSSAGGDKNLVMHDLRWLKKSPNGAKRLPGAQISHFSEVV